MAIGLLLVDKIGIEIKETMVKAIHAVVVFFRLDETMVEEIGGVGIGTKYALKFIFLLAVNDAVVHFHVERIIKGLISVGIESVVGYRNSAFVVVLLIGIPIVRKGAMYKSIVTTKSPEIAVAAVGYDKVFCFNRIEDGI